MATIATMKARLHRLEERSQPEPPVRFIILTGDDEGTLGPDDEGESFWFTIDLGRPGSGEEDPDA